MYQFVPQTNTGSFIASLWLLLQPKTWSTYLTLRLCIPTIIYSGFTKSVRRHFLQRQQVVPRTDSNSWASLSNIEQNAGEGIVDSQKDFLKGHSDGAPLNLADLWNTTLRQNIREGGESPGDLGVRELDFPHHWVEARPLSNTSGKY